MSSYWRIALEAADEARLLLAAGKPRGATSRAYYAMFDAARAALHRVDEELPKAKTHQTIIARFGRDIVAARGLDPEVGRFLNTTEGMRLVADYDQSEYSMTDAAIAVAQMERLLAAVKEFLDRAP